LAQICGMIYAVDSAAMQPGSQCEVSVADRDVDAPDTRSYS